jgi:signal transduction histidine kinase
MMALVVVVMILLWLFQIVFLESFYTRMRIADIKNEGRTIIGLLEQGKRSEFEDRLSIFAFNNNMNIELLDTSGNTAFTTGSTGLSGQMRMMTMMMGNSARNEVYKAAIAGKEAVVTLTHPRFGNKFMLTGLPVKMSGQLSGVLILNIPLAPVEDTASILKRQLLYIIPILMIASFLISFLISRKFTRPILEITKATEVMAAGNFSVRIKSKKQDEIGNLAETINYLGQELSKIEQLRKDLIANVSHELRTPLSLIRGYAETIRDVTGNAPDKREKQLGIIIDETERLSGIVDDILNLSQLQSGYFNLNKSRFPIKELLDNVVRRYTVLSDKTGIKIILTNTSEAILEADLARIEQVLYNLINNAFNHTPDGGSITVKGIDRQDTVRVEVSDTGSGIPQEELPHIWDRFYKAEKTSGKKNVGTGLGLAIVKNILNAHRASFGVESKKDEGTTFWFELKKAAIQNGNGLISS